MKIEVTYKDPDRFFEIVDENGNRRQALPGDIPDDVWGRLDEYLTVELDTETGNVKIV